MSTVFREAPPIVPPYNPSSAFWRFWNNEFTHPIEEFPTCHLVGKVALEEMVVGAEESLAKGLPLTAREIALLHDTEVDIRDEYDY